MFLHTDELRIALNVTNRTVARYISELENKSTIECKVLDDEKKI